MHVPLTIVILFDCRMKIIDDSHTKALGLFLTSRYRDVYAQMKTIENSTVKNLFTFSKLYRCPMSMTLFFRSNNIENCFLKV
jgi:hypothetical protein